MYYGTLWSCGFAIDIWKGIIKLLIPVYPRAVYTWGAVLWVVIHDKPMVYEQEEFADAIVMRHGLMEKKLIPLNPKIQTDKPQIWQLLSSKFPEFGQRLCIISKGCWIV